MSKLLFPNNTWDIPSLERTHEVLLDINKRKYQLDIYPSQIEIITFDQMIDLYASGGLPQFYNHWSFGKQQIHTENMYKQGRQGLAFEIVINTNPCRGYCMDTNSATMQALVISHALFGHNFFFKNNYLFKNQRNAHSILEYMEYARSYIEECEIKYGADEVEDLLDICHQLRYNGIDYVEKNRKHKNFEKEIVYWRNQIKDLTKDTSITERMKVRKKAEIEVKIKNINENTFPEENILYFIEKNSYILKPWQKEIVRIVRMTQNYFKPNMFTQVANEGCASFFHYHMMFDLFAEGYLTEGQMTEFLINHTNVIYQRDMTTDINPYALGFAILMDIKRACMDPDEEDKIYLADVCNTNWIETIKRVVSENRDDSLIRNYLSPKVIRKFELMNVNFNEENDFLLVKNTEQDVYEIRKSLAESKNFYNKIPKLEIVKVGKDGTLYINYIPVNGKKLDKVSGEIADNISEILWGRNVEVF